MQVSDFDYALSEGAIAQSAIEPRHEARLLITSTLEDRRFADLPDLLDSGDVLVVNRTRVRAARLSGRRPDSGGAVEALLLRRLDEERWEAMVRPSRRLRRGAVVEFGPITARLLDDPERGVATLALTAEDDVDDLLPTVGSVPLPPYFHGRLDDPDRYQTIFAKEVGSAAAPTAALHFTPWLVSELSDRGVEFAEVELRVGLDTFRPMADGDVADHQIHTEWFCVDEAAVSTVAAARARGGRVVAVGTTVVRALESAAATTGSLRPASGNTSLFIAPGYRSRVVDAMITNFHAPRTTLLALVAAYLGDDWRAVYLHALADGYRFLSFGDAMLIDRPVNR